jgi:hypothetical protein
MQAQEHRATELVVGAAPAAGADSTVTEKVDGTWHHVSTFPSSFRTSVLAELGRMAGQSDGPFPKEGSIRVRLKSMELKWYVRISGPDGDCVLTRMVACN